MDLRSTKLSYNGGEPPVAAFELFDALLEIGDFQGARQLYDEHLDREPLQLCPNRCTRHLRKAVAKGDLALVHFLLETQRPVIDVDPDDASLDGGSYWSKRISLLWMAVLYGFPRIAVLLARAGADVNELLGCHSLHDRSSSMLHVAMSAVPTPESEELIYALVDCGADVDARDSKGQSVLYYAAILNKPDVFAKLLQRGADVHAVCENRDTILHAVASSRHVDRLLPLLLARGVDVLAKDCLERNVLHCVTMNSDVGDASVLEALIEAGVPVGEYDLSGFTPLHYAVLQENEMMTEILLKNGAPINAENERGTKPLHLAAKSSNMTVLQLLLFYGADVRAVTKNGRTPLHNACLQSQDKNIELFQRLGADVAVKDSEGLTPFSLLDNTHLNPCNKIMIKRFAVLESLNCPIADRDKEILGKLPQVRTFYEKCLVEVAKMKSVKIYNAVSFFAIFAKTRYQLAALANNEDFVLAFRACDFESVFPIYCEDFRVTFEASFRMRNILCILQRELNMIFRNYLPACVISRISYYLSTTNPFLTEFNN